MSRRPWIRGKAARGGDWLSKCLHMMELGATWLGTTLHALAMVLAWNDTDGN